MNLAKSHFQARCEILEFRAVHALDEVLNLLVHLDFGFDWFGGLTNMLKGQSWSTWGNTR